MMFGAGRAAMRDVSIMGYDLGMLGRLLLLGGSPPPVDMILKTVSIDPGAWIDLTLVGPREDLARLHDDMAKLGIQAHVSELVDVRRKEVAVLRAEAARRGQRREESAAGAVLVADRLLTEPTDPALGDIIQRGRGARRDLSNADADLANVYRQLASDEQPDLDPTVRKQLEQQVAALKATRQRAVVTLTPIRDEYLAAAGAPTSWPF